MKVDDLRRLVVDVMKSKAEAEMQIAGRDLLYAPVFEYLSNIEKSNEAAE